MPEPEVRREFITRKFIDKARDPWEYVDEELPTTTVKLPYRSLAGRKRAPQGTHTGTYYIKGTHYDFGPGTFSLRITRLSVFAGSREVTWRLHHSRKGTLDVIYFPAAGQESRLASPLKPVFSVGPGTLSFGFLEAGSAYWSGYHMEGVVS